MFIKSMNTNFMEIYNVYVYCICIYVTSDQELNWRFYRQNNKKTSFSLIDNIQLSCDHFMYTEHNRQNKKF